MKPIPVFEMDLLHAKRRINSAIQDLFDRKDDIESDDLRQMQWELGNALKWLESVETYYKVSVTREAEQ